MTEHRDWPKVEFRVRNPTSVEKLKKFLIDRYGTHYSHMGVAVSEAIEMWLTARQNELQQQQLPARVSEQDFDPRRWRNLEKVKARLTEKEDWSGLMPRSDFYNLLRELGIKDARTHYEYYREITSHGLATPKHIGKSLFLRVSSLWVPSIVKAEGATCEFCGENMASDELQPHYRDKHYSQARYSGKFKEVPS